MFSNSLSFCIKHLISLSFEQREKIMQTLVIMSATAAPSEKDFIQGVVSMYKESYWRSNPELGEHLALQLFREGRIFQPRLEGKTTPCISGSRDVLWDSFKEFRNTLADSPDSKDLGWATRLEKYPSKDAILACQTPQELCNLLVVRSENYVF